MTYSRDRDDLLWRCQEGEGTHLDRTSLPSEDGRFAFVAEEIVSTIGELCTEDFGVPFQNLAVAVLSIIAHLYKRYRP